MGDRTSIEWTDSTWNPIRARNHAAQVGEPGWKTGLSGGKTGWHCEHVSEGCRNCYAESINRRLGTGLDFKPGHRFDVEIFLDEQMLLAPLRWKKPRRIFVNSMSDTFAEFVKDEWIDRMFAVMALCPQHTFQVLTKRAARMREYMTVPVQGSWAGRVTRVDDDGTSHPEWDAPWRLRSGVLCDLLPKAPAAALNSATSHLGKRYGEDGYDGFMPRWPLPNVWLGVSAERQQEADERVPDLLATPAAVRFVSLEPLLGPIDLSKASGPVQPFNSIWWDTKYPGGREPQFEGINWVIVGGESGKGARPMHPQWARDVRDQCASAGVPFHFKQWGEWLPGEANHGQFDPRPMHAYRRCDNLSYEWPQTSRVENFGTHADRWSGDMTTRRIGKVRAGRLLDGIEHNGMPS